MRSFRHVLMVLTLLSALLAGCAGSPEEPVDDSEELTQREQELDEREQSLSQWEDLLKEREEALSLREEDLSTREEALSQEEVPSEEPEHQPDAGRVAGNPDTSGDPVQIVLQDPFDEWLESLDPDQTGGYYMNDNGLLHINVLDPAAFQASDAMAEAEEKGWADQFALVTVKYSWRQLVTAQEKLMDLWDECKIGSTAQDTMRDCMIVYTMDMDEKNRQRMMDYCGIDNIEFYYTDSLVNPGT